MIENIDIGGPAMMRAAAKNFESVFGVVVSPDRYEAIIDEMGHRGRGANHARDPLRAHETEAFAHTAAYDAAVASWFAGREDDALPRRFRWPGIREGERILRYGENPHQRGALLRGAASQRLLAGAEVLQGKEMSFNNWLN